MNDRKYIIGIIDDNSIDRNRLTTRVQVMCRNFEISAEVLPFDSAEAALQHNENFSILFLDEELANGKDKKINGHELKEILRLRNDNCLIIYISSHREYIDTAFGTNVMGFVIKGSKNEAGQLMRSFANCLRELDHMQNIMYLESQNHHLKITYLTGDEEIVRSTMDSIEKKLEDAKNFVRCQRSYIINLDFVESIEGNFERLIMKNGHIISVSRRKKEDVKRRYMEVKLKRMEQILGD